MKDQLEKVVEEERARLGLDPAHLSLSYFNDEAWAVVFNGERYAPEDYADPQYIKRVVDGKEETADEKAHRKAEELRKQAEKPDDSLEGQEERELVKKGAEFARKQEKKEPLGRKRGRPKKA